MNGLPAPPTEAAPEGGGRSVTSPGWGAQTRAAGHGMEAGPDALVAMLMTLLTFHADRSPLKAAALSNTARPPPSPQPARQPPPHGDICGHRGARTQTTTHSSRRHAMDSARPPPRQRPRAAGGA